MSEQQIRLEILKIQDKYYTPNSKIAKACGVNRSLISQLLTETYPAAMYDNVLKKLEIWLEGRMI